MLILKNIAHLVVNANTILHDVDLITEGNRIAKIGANLSVPDGAETIDCRRCAVLPGFVNAHTHLYQTLLVGQRDDLSLAGWCDQVLTPPITALYGRIPPKERERFSYLWTAVGICQMLRSGVTAFFNMDINYAQDGMFRAAREANVRSFIGLELADLFLSDEKGLKRDLAEVERLLKTYPGNCVITPSEPNLCSETALSALSALALQYGALVQVHVDETAREAAQCVSERGKTELEYLDSLGFLSPRFSAVHGVHLTRREIELAALRGVTVVYNPKSNAKLGSAVCPIPALRQAGVNLSLATDGPASNDRLDMFEEMRFGAMLQKAALSNPEAVTASDVFTMATAGGANMLLLDAGELKEGKLADFSILPLDRPGLAFGTADLISTIVYCAESGDVRDVYVGGKPALKNGMVTGFDESAVTQEFYGILHRLLNEIQVLSK
ncbi:MAG: amidohydrolase [Clostridiaceae bacterium]